MAKSLVSRLTRDVKKHFTCTSTALIRTLRRLAVVRSIATKCSGVHDCKCSSPWFSASLALSS